MTSPLSVTTSSTCIDLIDYSTSTILKTINVAIEGPSFIFDSYILITEKKV